MTTVDVKQAMLVLERQREGIQRSPQRFALSIKKIFAQARAEILVDAHTAPYQSPLPFIWSLDPRKQERAQRWWFANYVNNPNRPKGSRNRYVRTTQLDNATEVVGVVSPDSGSLTLDNKRKGAWYVFGQGQVPSHARSGHPRFDKVAEKWRVILPDQVTKAWFSEEVREASR